VFLPAETASKQPPSGIDIALQRLHPIFDSRVNAIIDAATGYLAASGILTPTLVRTKTGESFHLDADGGVWRALTWIDGVTHVRAGTAAKCETAGRVLGQFHRALSDYTGDFAGGRFGIHDLKKHLAALRETLNKQRHKAAHQRVGLLANKVFVGAESVSDMSWGGNRIVHGDPKISNVLFDSNGNGLCMVDLDTLGPGPIALELGDALRSWCNDAPEDEPNAEFSASHFAASIQAYATVARDSLQPDEVAAIVPGLKAIALELSARFCADALNESYFSWDDSRFKSAAEHNLVRAWGQYSLFEQVSSRDEELSKTVKAAFS